MSSGFIQLAALGQQDVYLTGTPTLTYFASVYKRHTPFVLESFEIPFLGSGIEMGQNNIVRIPVKGDLVRATTLKLNLPPLAEYGQDWFWLNIGGTVSYASYIADESYYQTIQPASQQYYSTNNSITWNSGGAVYYDQNQNKFIFYVQSYLAVNKFDPLTGLTASGIFWGFDPKNAAYEDATSLYYLPVDGLVTPDFTLEQAGWSRTIGEPVNTCQGLFLKLNTSLTATGYINFADKNGGNSIWTNEDSPSRYVITNGGRINITVPGNYMIRASFKGTIQFGSDANDGPPNTTNFWSAVSQLSSNPLLVFSQPITSIDITQNWYFFINGELEPGSYISIQPIDSYFGPNPPYSNTSTVEFTSGQPLEISNFGTNGNINMAIAPTIIAFNNTGSYLVSGILNTTTTCIINSIEIKNGEDQGTTLLTYDFSQQPSRISEFCIPLVIESPPLFLVFILNTVNGVNGSIDLSTSFISITSLGLTTSSPSGSFILPDNGILFQPSNVITAPLKFSSNFINHGVENMIAVVANTITFNNVGTYMMTTYLPIVNTNSSTAWDPVLAIPPVSYYGSLQDIEMVLSNGDLTVTSVGGNYPTMLLANTFQTGTKLMFSVTLDTVSQGQVTSVGIGNLIMDTTQPLGLDSNSFGYYENGVVLSQIDKDVTCPEMQSSNVIDIAVDTISMKLWVRVEGGQWSSNIGGSGGDPNMGSLGFDISYINMTGGYKFGVNVFKDLSAGQATYNTSNLYTIPDGFTFVPGVSNVNVNINNLNTYTNVNFQDTIFGDLGTDIAMDSNKDLYFQDLGLVILKNSSIYVGVPLPSGAVNGTGLSCQCAAISGMAIDSQDWLYFGDDQGAILRVVYPGQFVRTVAGGGTQGDGSGFDATFTSIISIKTYGSYVYIQDGGYDNTTIRRCSWNSYGLVVETFYNNIGFATNAGDPYHGITALTVNPSTGALYGALGTWIVSLNSDNGNITTISGVYESGVYDGLTGSTTRFTYITAMVASDVYIYVSDNGRLRRVDIVTGGTTTYDGSRGGFFQNPENPVGLYARDMILKDGALYFTHYNLVQKFDFVNQLSNVYGTGNEGFRTTGGSYTQNIPIRVDSAPMTYPVSIGHAGASFAPGAFVWVYPITSGVLPVDYSQYHYYDSVGTWAIQTAELKIGGQTIETLTGEAIELWNDLNVPYENQPALKLLTGKYDTTIASGRDYYVNLPFYYYGNSGSYLPISIINRQDVEIWITFKTLQDLTAIITAPNPVQASLIVEYVYLAQPEITWLSNTKLEYVIEQFQYHSIGLEPGFKQGVFPVSFDNPVTALFFVIQVDGSVPYDYSNDGLSNLGISFNGEEILTNRITDVTQLGVIEPFDNFINFPTRNFYMKTFKSPINFSRLRQVLLNLNISRTDGYYPAKTLRILTVSKNVLRVADGLGGLMFISQ